jgi:hypothetical protein
MKDKKCSIFYISDSPLFNKDANIDIKRHTHDKDNYLLELDKATKEGIAFSIDGLNPNEEELKEIKKILDKNGTVKVFRNRKKIIDSKISVKPSVFNTISVSVNKVLEVGIKEKACKYIENLIDSD